MTLELEFTVEPFEAARTTGGVLTVGPFGTSLAGEREQVLAAVAEVVRAAIGAGATRVTLQVSTGSEDDR